jgi:hypothetical protein
LPKRYRGRHDEIRLTTASPATTLASVSLAFVVVQRRRETRLDAPRSAVGVLTLPHP